MNLPDISIPKAIVDSLPIDQVPALAHPPLVHFAIVLPIMIVLLEFVNIIVKRGETPEEPKGRGVSTLSFLLILAMVIIFSAAYVAGTVDGKAAWDTLGSAGQAELKEHKLIGTYLVYGSIVLLVFKFISLAGTKSRILLLLLAIAFAGATLKQGKDGGELVYTYGANVEKVTDLDDELFDLKEELDDLKSAKAEAKKPEDSVAKKEEAAIANPKMTEGVPAAKAKVEEAQDKEKFEAKEERENFKKETKADEQKEVTPEEVKSVAKEEAAAIANPEAVKDEAAADVKKEVTPEEVKTVESEAN